MFDTKITLEFPYECLPSKYQAMLEEIREIYSFDGVEDALRWLLEPDLTATVKKKLRKNMKFARSYKANHLPGE